MTKSIDQQPGTQASMLDMAVDTAAKSKAKHGMIAKLMIASAMTVGMSVASAQSAGVGTSTETGAMSGGQSQMGGQGQMGNMQTSPNAMMPPVSGPASSADPYVQKREADAMAKKEYKEQKKASKLQYKREKAEAKAAMKAEKRDSTAERGAAIAADPSKPVTQGQQSYGGK